MKFVAYFFLICSTALSSLDGRIVPKNIEAVPWYPLCTGMDEDTPELSECCPLAGMNISPEDKHNCSHTCLIDGGKACCYDVCFAQRAGFFQGFQMDPQGVYNAFAYGKSINSTVDKFLKSTISYCLERLSNRNSNQFTCGIPNSMFYLTQCVATHTYWNCGNYTRSARCEELHRLMWHCVDVTTPAAMQNK